MSYIKTHNYATSKPVESVVNIKNKYVPNQNKDLLCWSSFFPKKKKIYEGYIKFEYLNYNLFIEIFLNSSLTHTIIAAVGRSAIVAIAIKIYKLLVSFFYLCFIFDKNSKIVVFVFILRFAIFHTFFCKYELENQCCKYSGSAKMSIWVNKKKYEQKI